MTFAFRTVDEDTLVAALAWHGLGPSRIARETGLSYGKVQYIMRKDGFAPFESTRSLDELVELAHGVRDPESVSI